MEGEKIISLDGKITSWREADLAPELLFGHNWVYTTINTSAHKPLHLSLKLRYALDSYHKLFGSRPQIEVAELEREVRNLLYYGLYPECGNTVNLYLIPTGDGGCRRLLIHEATTPYEKHQTNVSMTAARFADNYAAAYNYDSALRANRAGTLISSGDNPLFALRGNTLLTTPIDKGARGSAERELMFRLAELCGVAVVEEELKVEDATTYEELIVFTPVGLQSIYSLGDMKLGNIYATLLGKHLATLLHE